MLSKKIDVTIWIVASLVFVLLGGCATRRTMVIIVPDRDGHVGEAVVHSGAGRQLLDAAGQAAVVKNEGQAPEKIETLEDSAIRDIFGEALAAEPPEPERFYLYFKSGTTQLNEESLLLLSEIINCIRIRQSMDICVNGHTDRVGTDAFNRELSMQRALRIEELLTKAGVERKSIATTSHGEGNPLVSTPDDVPEPLNRRVEVIVR